MVALSCGYVDWCVWLELECLHHGRFCAYLFGIYLPFNEYFPGLIPALLVVVKVTFLSPPTLGEDEETAALVVVVVRQTRNMWPFAVYILTSASNMGPTGFLAFRCVPRVVRRWFQIVRDLGWACLVRGGWHTLLYRLSEVDGLELVQDELHQLLVVLDLLLAH